MDKKREQSLRNSAAIRGITFEQMKAIAEGKIDPFTLKPIEKSS